MFAALFDLQTLYDRLGLNERAGITPERLATDVGDGSIDRVVISATAFPESLVSNDVVAGVISQMPETLVGCASVDPTLGMSAMPSRSHGRH